MTRQADHPPIRRGAVAPQKRSSQIPFVGAILVGGGFILSASGRSLHWPWLRFAPYAMMLGVAILLVVGLVPIQRAMFTEFWGWFQAAAARNERRAQRQASGPKGEGEPPAA